ncbi:MAG: right-handed parallel beta-helix repeat-containing protein, partial [Pseudomonadota bacterium]
MATWIKVFSVWFLLFTWVLTPSQTWADTFWVTSTADAGPGSLRAAIQAANASNSAPHLIQFNLSGDAPYVINLDSALPTLGRTIAIDGGSLWVDGRPGVHLDGSELSVGSGITINSNANGSSVIALAITGFPQHGITSQGDDIRIDGCHIGVAPDGITVIGNGQIGVHSLGDRAVIGSGFTIGNLISGNTSYGISISGGADSSIIRGNRIGSNIDGSVALPNGAGGIFADASSYVQVGGDTLGEGNLISGNAGYGMVFNDNASNWVVQGNTIGLSLAGTVPLSNLDGGVLVRGPDHQFGGSSAFARNVISGNGGSGVLLSHGTNDVVLLGNYLGTDASGTTAVGVQQYGIRTSGTVLDCRIGVGQAGGDNLISGNERFGIALSDEVSGCRIRGNHIGTDIDGLETIPNGVGVDLKGSENILGGSGLNEGNLISGNQLQGVVLSGNDQLVVGNWIGLDVTGQSVLPNGASGVRAIDAVEARIGLPGVANVIAGNYGHGVSVNSGSRDLIIRGNRIGVDPSGALALGNAQSGVRLAGQGHQLGGDRIEDRNQISANGQSGVVVDADETIVTGNWIGTDSGGTERLGNGESGIRVIGGTDLQIGGLGAGMGNLISGNGSDGITLSNGTAGALIRQNQIGTDAFGVGSLGNHWNGISISGKGHVIGGVETLARNLISGNELNGLLMRGIHHDVQGNYIGTNTTGFQSLGNGGYGVRMMGTQHVLLGGDLKDHGNLISGNGRGVSLEQGARWNQVFNNIIGLNVMQNSGMDNPGSGIQIFSDENEIGAPGKGNVIATHSQNGIELNQSAQLNRIQGNWIGTNDRLDPGLGNGDVGVMIQRANNNLIGGIDSGEGNVIADHRLSAVRAYYGNGNEISANSIVGNGDSGIDIGVYQLEKNDPLDMDDV